VLRSKAERRDLGQTAEDGHLDVLLSTLDASLHGQPIAEDERAQLLIHDRVVAELPLGEIIHRTRVIEATLAEADSLLADRSPDRDYAQELLGRMLDLQMRGIADPRIADRSSRLYEHLHETASIWSVPRRLLDRAKDLLSTLRHSSDDKDVPAEVQRSLEKTADTGTVEPQSFSWALRMLPTMCKITVRGGAVAAGQLIATGAPGVALAIIAASVGDDLSNWLIKSCCEMASQTLSHDSSGTTCK
jgi:hypothetical protein